MKSDWTVNDIPDLSGKVCIVTGANIGLGLEIATQLAKKSATVILACRTPSKGESARDQIISKFPDANVSVMQLDVSSNASVRAFATSFLSSFDRLDVVMCNAGVMALEKREESVDGNELQFATNHLGHYLLVGLLYPLLKSTPGTSRVVTQSSSANWTAVAESYDDLNAKKEYARWKQYSMTKLANVIFANSLNDKCQDSKAVKAYAAHPGLVIGQLQWVSAAGNPFYNLVYRLFSPLAGTYETGALPALYACTAEEAEEADTNKFYAPNGWMNGTFRGPHPKEVEPNKLAADKEIAEKLWKASEELTGFKYEF